MSNRQYRLAYLAVKDKLPDEIPSMGACPPVPQVAIVLQPPQPVQEPHEPVAQPQEDARLTFLHSAELDALLSQGVCVRRND